MEVLANHSGCDPEDDDQDEDDGNGDVQKIEDSDDACLLAEEAVVMDSSLDGTEYAGRGDWIVAVNSCKTFFKVRSLICAFVRRASDKLGKLETEKKALLGALSAWAKEEESKQRNRNNKTKYRKSDEKAFSTTEVWANVRFTEEYCMVKLEADPWWPAEKCEPNADQLESLASVKRTLVALLGEEGALRVVTNDLDLADANMSDDENDEGRASQAWKRSLHRLKSIQARKHAQVRQAVTEAIGAAWRAQIGAVVAQLRSALMLHHP